MPSGDLLIEKTSWDQMGTYTCTAENDFGSDRVQAFFYPTKVNLGLLSNFLINV